MDVTATPPKAVDGMQPHQRAADGSVIPLESFLLLLLSSSLASAVGELRLLLVDEGAHADLLVLGGEGAVKQPPLEVQALLERHLVALVHRLLGHRRDRLGVPASRVQGAGRQSFTRTCVQQLRIHSFIQVRTH